MIRPARLLQPLALALILILALGACHTDPFSVKPEVPGVEIPKKPAEPAEAPAAEDHATAPDAQP